MSRKPRRDRPRRAPDPPVAVPRERARADALATAGPTPAVPRLWSAAVGLVALGVYLFLCPPVSGDKDAAELTLVLAFNGVSHPTGYPLWTLLGHPFVRLLHALGVSWQYAANAWSALGGGVAVGFLHALAARLVPPRARRSRRARFLLALLPVLFFAFNPAWTSETTLAEVYSWHVAWVLGTACFFVGLVRTLAGREAPPTPWLYRRAAAWGLLCGLGGAHHATSILTAAPLSIALLVPLLLRRRLRAGLVFTVLAAALVPLGAYGFIYWRGFHPAAVQWADYIPGWRGFLYHITGQQYRLMLGFFLPSPEQQRSLAANVYPFLFPGLALLLVAAARARDLAERTILWGLLAAGLVGTAYVFLYGVNDPSSYFLAPMALACLAIPALGGAWLAASAVAKRSALAAGLVLALLALALWGPWLREGHRRSGYYQSVDRRVHELWRTIPPDSAVVFWANDMFPKLREYQLLGGERPDLEILHPMNLIGSRERLRYIARYGFDPTENLPVWSARDAVPGRADSLVRYAIQLVERNVNRHRRLPVIEFEPGIPAIRVLPKPSTDSAVTGTR